MVRSKKALGSAQELQEVIDEMRKIVESIVDTAEQLKQLSTTDYDSEEMGALQAEQENLIQQLTDLDRRHKALHERHGDADDEAYEKARTRIIERLHFFETLNKNFIENLEVRKGLIKIELGEVQRQKKSLEKLSHAYAKGGSSSKKVNTTT